MLKNDEKKIYNEFIQSENNLWENLKLKWVSLCQVWLGQSSDGFGSNIFDPRSGHFFVARVGLGQPPLGLEDFH